MKQTGLLASRNVLAHLYPTGVQNENYTPTLLDSLDCIAKGDRFDLAVNMASFRKLQTEGHEISFV